VFATGAVEEPSEPEAVSLRPLTIGLMPAVDSIPLIVAEAEGFFADEGLDVTLELFRDQVYREAALQANTIDGTISDLVNAIRAWDNEAGYRVVVSTQGFFSFVTASGSGIETPDDWPQAPETVETGLLKDSIINYTSQRMLQAAGLDPGRVEIVPTTQIPVRMEMVVAGRLEAAVLPEPVTRIATAGGAHELVSTQLLDWTPGVLIVTDAALREKPAELDALLRAYDRAVTAINDDPDAYRRVVVERAAFPPPTANTMRIPTYRPAAVPTAEQVRDVAAWMRDEGLIGGLPPHEEIVAARPFTR
jgi:NitT/TauT family transport system substrate-binding protein